MSEAKWYVVHTYSGYENKVKANIDKSSLFDAIEAGGVLPRKTFSIGEDIQKRYYMECRKLTK